MATRTQFAKSTAVLIRNEEAVRSRATMRRTIRESASEIVVKQYWCRRCRKTNGTFTGSLIFKAKSEIPFCRYRARNGVCGAMGPMKHEKRSRRCAELMSSRLSSMRGFARVQPNSRVRNRGRRRGATVGVLVGVGPAPRAGRLARAATRFRLRPRPIDGFYHSAFSNLNPAFFTLCVTYSPFDGAAFNPSYTASGTSR